jgi:hypothetical protein
VAAGSKASNAPQGAEVRQGKSRGCYAGVGGAWHGLEVGYLGGFRHYMGGGCETPEELTRTGRDCDGREVGKVAGLGRCMAG